MTKVTKPDGTTAVNEFMAVLEHPFKAEVEAVRAIILNANAKVQERVKWNAPSFYYKYDIAAFNLRATKFVQLVLVFHNGWMIEDRFDLLEGDYKDRRLARFTDMQDVRSKKDALHRIVNAWVALADNEPVRSKPAI